MKPTQPIRKTALVALLLAGVLFLGGCSLIVKDPEVDARQVIVDVNGETITKARFTEIYNNAYNRAYEEQAMYQQYGLIQQINLDPEQIMLDTLDSAALDTLLHQKAEELGLRELSEEETAAIETEAETRYQDILGQVKEAFFKDSTLAEEELQAAMKAKAEELGFTPDLFIQDGKEQDLHEKLRAHFAEGLAVSDEEVKTEFDARVEKARADYETTPASYGTALTGGQPVYYAPAGYRFIKQILVKLPAEDDSAIKALQGEITPLQTALDEAQASADRVKELLKAEAPNEADAAFLKEQQAALSAEELVQLAKLSGMETLEGADLETLKALQAKVPAYQALETARAAFDAKNAELTEKADAAFAALLPQAQEIHAKAAAEGADFDALVKEFNEDTGMPEAGYPVSAASTNFVDAFTQPAMALANIGDVSEPSRSDYGWHIMQYAADIPEGPVALDTVSEAIRTELLEQKQEEAYNAAVEEWKAAADIKKYPERMDD